MAQLIQRSFTGGEIAPALRLRADINKYANGLARCENFFIKPQGGVYSRPGFRFVGAVTELNGLSISTVRLVPFIFNSEQSYVLVFDDYEMYVIKDGAFVMSGGSVYSVTHPFGSIGVAVHVSVWDFQFTQDADVMTFTVHERPVYQLQRLADDNWNFVQADFSPTVSPPTWTIPTVNISNITNDAPALVETATAHNLVEGTIIKIDGVGGMIEVNGNEYKVDNIVSANQFEISDLDGVAIDSTSYGTYTTGGTVSQDEIIAVGTGAGSNDKKYSYVVTVVDENGIESLASEQRSIVTPSLSETAGVQLSWQAETTADYYRVYKDPSEDTNSFGWIGDTENTRFVDYNIAPITSDAPPRDRNPFNPVSYPVAGDDNLPAVVGYYQQRLIFANTLAQPQTVFTTQTGVYNSFRRSTPARDDDSIEFTMKAKQVNEIRHIVSLDSLIVLTSSAEFRITEGRDEVLTPFTVGFKVQSYNGASTVPPEVVDDSVLYVQSKGSKIRDMKYDFANDKYQGNDLSIMAEHLFKDHTITQLAYAAEPDGILWAVRDDGILLGLTYQREHQVWAWHQHNTDGEILSVSSIPENGKDAVYVAVKRVINGVDEYYVERLEDRITSSPEDVFCVDSGLSYDGAATDTFSGLDHLEGEDVVAVADGVEVTGLTVASGSVTLPEPASKVSIGLPYTPILETLEIDNPGEASIRASEVTVSKVRLAVEESRGGWVGSEKDDGTFDMVEIKPRFPSYGYGAIPLQTFMEEVIVQPEWNKGGSIRVEQRSPFPLAILAVIPDVDFGF